MPAPLSIDLRQRHMAAYEAKEGAQRQLAERFKVSLSFISFPVFVVLRTPRDTDSPIQTVRQSSEKVYKSRKP